jgi:hypothetical protein
VWEKKNREHRNLYRSEIRAASNFPARTAMPKSTTMLKGRALTKQSAEIVEIQMEPKTVEIPMTTPEKRHFKNSSFISAYQYK